MSEKQRIYSLKSGSLNESERIEIARLLLKAGYAARLKVNQVALMNTLWNFGRQTNEQI